MPWRTLFVRRPDPHDQTMNTDRRVDQWAQDTTAQREDQLLRDITARTHAIGLDHTRAATIQNATPAEIERWEAGDDHAFGADMFSDSAYCVAHNTDEYYL